MYFFKKICLDKDFFLRNFALTKILRKFAWTKIFYVVNIFKIYGDTKTKNKVTEWEGVADLKQDCKT